MKQLGAVSLQDAVWVLPQTARTQEQFQWLASDIQELGGEAILWEADQLDATSGEQLRQRFIDAVDAEYQEILTAVKRKNPDLAELSKRFQLAQSRDYFQSRIGITVRDRLVALSRGTKR